MHRRWITRGPALAAIALVGCASAPARIDAPVPPTPRQRLAIELGTLEAELTPRSGPFTAVMLEDPEDAVAGGLREALLRASTGDGVARIVVLGGSHVAGDLVTGPLRRALQRHFGDAGHGFVLPLPPYDRYWQSGIEVDEGEGWRTVEPSFKHRVADHYGPLASALEPVEPAFVSLRTAGAPASQVEVLYMAQPGGGALELTVDDAMVTIDTSDVEAHAASMVLGVSDGEHRVVLRADGEAPVRWFGLVLERAHAGVVVDQIGMNGITPTMLLLAEPETSTAFLRARRPDVAVLWLGGNESGEWWPVAHHEEQLRGLLERLRAELPGVPCLVLGALDRRQQRGETWEVPPTLLALLEAQHRTAIEAGCAFYDSSAWQGGPGAVERLEADHPSWMRADRVHLTGEGYEQYAADLLRALIAAMR